nr:unnamed protein product [Digitaria exilis]
MDVAHHLRFVAAVVFGRVIAAAESIGRHLEVARCIGHRRPSSPHPIRWFGKRGATRRRRRRRRMPNEETGLKKLLGQPNPNTPNISKPSPSFLHPSSAPTPASKKIRAAAPSLTPPPHQLLRVAGSPSRPRACSGPQRPALAPAIRRRVPLGQDSKLQCRPDLLPPDLHLASIPCSSAAIIQGVPFVDEDKSPLFFSLYLTKWVLAKDEGPPEMSEISDAIRDGAEGFFRTQYGTISKMACILAFVILGIYLFRTATPQQEASGLGRATSAYITVASFLLGALCSGIAGFVGMWVSVRANVRVSSAARRSAREALQIAVRAGGFSAIVVVCMAVFGVALLYSTFYVWLGVDSPGSMKVADLPLLLVGYGFGASFVALFAQLGGGIYTKAADVGADLVGKVEQGIPEDDPRNPAVIADLTSGLVDESGNPTGGLFGTAVATMGMLSTAGYVLTMDMFGPIADNAGGIVEMSQQPESVREITDVLDAVGNTTKATTKGFAIGSAALASFLLFSAYMDEVASFAQLPFKEVDIAVPEIFVGGLLGSMLIFLFSAWACSAVGKTAQEVVNEVRRQFIERPGIMDYKEKPDYGRCVAIVASASLREMIRPGALAIISPMAVGVIFRILGHSTGQPLLGAKVVASMLMFATVAGILMALFLNTAGGAWDNAKKYIETGALGGKGSESHKAAVTGDTVGDPFKDTAGPSLHVLIKMLATITLVMAPIFL